MEINQPSKPNAWAGTQFIIEIWEKPVDGNSAFKTDKTEAVEISSMDDFNNIMESIKLHNEEQAHIASEAELDFYTIKKLVKL